MEIKNKLTVITGARGGGKKGTGQSRNMCKGPMDNDNGRGVGTEGLNVGSGGWVGQGRVMGEKQGHL